MIVPMSPPRCFTDTVVRLGFGFLYLKKINTLWLWTELTFMQPLNCWEVAYCGNIFVSYVYIYTEAVVHIWPWVSKHLDCISLVLNE